MYQKRAKNNCFFVTQTLTIKFLYLRLSRLLLSHPARHFGTTNSCYDRICGFWKNAVHRPVPHEDVVPNEVMLEPVGREPEEEVTTKRWCT